MFIDNLAIGRYVEKDSIMHSLDPRVKLLGLFILAGFAFAINSFYDVGLMTIYTFSLILLSKLPIMFYLKSLKPLLFIIVFAFTIQLLTADGEILLSLGIFKVTDQGLFNASIITFRILFAIMVSTVLTLTTTPTSLAHAMEDILRWFFIPKSFAHEISMVMTIAIRFIPVMASEADRIIKAQLSRGANFDERKLTGKIKGAVSIIIPLLVSALRRADELSIAMEARGYSGYEGRSRFKKFNWRFRDSLFFISFILIAISIVLF